MSLLDVIKFPITTEFNQKDLERIPAELLIDWWMNAPGLRDFRNTHNQTSAYIMCPSITNTERAGYIRYVLNCYHSRIHPKILKSLKKYLEEYDPTPRN